MAVVRPLRVCSTELTVKVCSTHTHPSTHQLTPVSYYPMELIKLTWQRSPTLWVLCHPSLSNKLQSFATWNVHPCDNGEITGTFISCGRDIVIGMTIILTIEEEITHGLPSDKHVWMPLQLLETLTSVLEPLSLASAHYKLFSQGGPETLVIDLLRRCIPHQIWIC
jgi:hypothetical protein